MPRVTLSDIADCVGYSKNTVSLALRSDPQIPEATRAVIRETAERMGYRPNPVLSHLMAELRASQTPRFQAKLALVNANRDPAAFHNHPTIPTYVAGCESRAEKLGYSFDRFWLHDPSLKAASWLRVMRARSIKGIVLVGLMDSNCLPPYLAPVWEEMPTVVTGVRTRNPALPFACVDHHGLIIDTFEHTAALGYLRPALVIDDVIDQLVGRRFSAGFISSQRELPRADRVPIFSSIEEAKHRPALFQKWMNTHRPDVVLTLYNCVMHWLADMGLSVPGDVGVVQLEWRSSRPDISGMNQHNEVTGAAAVDMVINQIHNHESGVAEYPRATVIGTTWMDGGTVRKVGPVSEREVDSEAMLASA